MFSEIGLSSVSGDNRISEWQALSDSTYLIEGSRNMLLWTARFKCDEGALGLWQCLIDDGVSGSRRDGKPTSMSPDLSTERNVEVANK